VEPEGEKNLLSESAGNVLGLFIGPILPRGKGSSPPLLSSPFLA